MEKKDIAQALNEIEEKYIEEASEAMESGKNRAMNAESTDSGKNAGKAAAEESSQAERSGQEEKKKGKKFLRFPARRWIAAAAGACAVFVVCLTAVVLYQPLTHSGNEAAYERKSYEGADYAAEDMYGGEYGMSFSNSAAGSMMMEEAAMDADMMDTASTSSFAGSADPATMTGAAQETEAAAEKTEQKLVYTANINMQTLTYPETVSSVRDLVKKYNGIIQSESEYDSNHNWYNTDSQKAKMTLSITIRIPSEHYEDFLKDLDGNGRILSKSSWVDNITRSYYSQKAVLEGLELQEERPLDMLKKAESIEDMIAVKSRLTEVQTQLNQARTTLSGLDFDVEYSTVNLSIEEEERYTQTEIERASFIDRLKETLVDAGYMFMGAMEALLFALIYLAPYAVIILIVVLLIRAIVRKRKASKLKKQQKEEKI